MVEIHSLRAFFGVVHANTHVIVRHRIKRRESRELLVDETDASHEHHPTLEIHRMQIEFFFPRKAGFCSCLGTDAKT